MKTENNHLIKRFERTLSFYFDPNDALLLNTESLSFSGPKNCIKSQFLKKIRCIKKCGRVSTVTDRSSTIKKSDLQIPCKPQE